jgi:hypothetical protein
MHSRLPIVLTGMVVASFAGNARSATVDRQKFDGSQVATTFSADAAIRCSDGTQGSVFAMGFISGSQSITKQPGTRKVVDNGVFVEIDAYSNSCTGVNFGFAEGAITGGFSPPNNNLVSARLAGSADAQDFDTGATIHVTLDLVVSGTGSIVAEKANTKTRTIQGEGGPFTITIARSANANRAGTVTGTITIAGVVLHPEFFGTTLLRNSSSTITIEK